jgi:hypothetical protein
MGDGEATTTTRGHVPHYIEDLDWLINDAPAALGERGVNQDPSAGGGRTLADNWGFIERAHAAQGDVRRERRLKAIWVKLTTREQNVLSAYYTKRKVLIVTGATAAFGQHASVAMMLTSDTRELGDDGRPTSDRLRLVHALSDQNNKRHVPMVSRARRLAEKAVDGAHESWATAKRLVAVEWAGGA